MLIVSFVGFYWGREEGKREGEDGKRVKLWTYSKGMVESISNPNSVMSIYLHSLPPASIESGTYKQ